MLKSDIDNAMNEMKSISHMPNIISVTNIIKEFDIRIDDLNEEETNRILTCFLVATH